MSDELRAAAVKILEAAKSGDCPFNWGMVAEAYLSEYPAEDDEKLLTCNWLSTVTTPCDDGMLLGHVHEMAVEIEPGPDGLKVWFCFPDKPPVPVRSVSTRGDVRRLLAALGIDP